VGDLGPAWVEVQIHRSRQKWEGTVAVAESGGSFAIEQRTTSVEGTRTMYNCLVHAGNNQLSPPPPPTVTLLDKVKFYAVSDRRFARYI
jgi:hypothetical protein